MSVVACRHRVPAPVTGAWPILLLSLWTRGSCNGPEHPLADIYCSIGETCDREIKGTGLSLQGYFTVSQTPCNGGNRKEVMTVPIQNYYSGRYDTKERLSFQITPISAAVGDVHLCWAPFAHRPANIPAAHLHIGPVPSARACVLGVLCNPRFVQHVQYNSGVFKLAETEFAVVPKGSACDGETYAELGDRWSSPYIEVSQVSEDTEASFFKRQETNINFGTPSLREEVGKCCQLCWSTKGGMASAPSSDPPRAVDTAVGGALWRHYEATKLSLDSFGLIGPSPQDARPKCVAGFPCEIFLEGYLLGTVEDTIQICGGYKAEKIEFSPPEEEDSVGAANLTVNWMLGLGEQSSLQEPLCWQANNGEEFQVGTVVIRNDCPRRTKNWPLKDGMVTLPAGKSQAELFLAKQCEEGKACVDCQKAVPEDEKYFQKPTFRRSAYFVLVDEQSIVRSCSEEQICDAEDCFVEFTGEPVVETGSKLQGTAYVNTKYECQNKAKLVVVAFGCQKFAVITFMFGVALVLFSTVVIGLCLEFIAKKAVRSCFEGTIELRCTSKEHPSFSAIRSCVTQAVKPDYMQWFDAWSSGSTIFARFRLPSKAKPIRHWVTEVPGLCRVDATSIQKVQTPGRLPGAGLLELAEACVACMRKSKNIQEEEALHFEYACAMLEKLRNPWMQAALMVQYACLIVIAVGLPITAGHLMEDCDSGYPIWLHCMWGVFQLFQMLFQRCLLIHSHPDQDITSRFLTRFRLRLLAGTFVGIVSQTDMYMDLTFPVIAKACNFELWYVASWLCALGIGFGQVGQSLFVIILGKIRARRAISPERRERAELSVIFFLLRVTDNVGLCFAVRPALDQRLGGSSSWAARIAEARVPTARFIFEDVEQSALQVIFLVFFEVAKPADVVWIALSITTSLLLSLLLMVQVLPEVRDWIWYRLLAVVRRRFRIPLLFAVFILYRIIASAPWVFACSRFVEDATFLGIEVRQQVLNEVLSGIFLTTVSLAMCCFIMWSAWKMQVQPPPKFQPPMYDAAVRFSPKAFGAWSTEQDEWLEPLRTFMAKEQDPKHRSAMERLDNELFKLRHGFSNKEQALEALNAENIPDAVIRCGQWVLGTAQLRERVQDLLKDRRFTSAQIWKKSQMIDSIAAEALANTKLGKVSSKDYFRLLPHRVLKHGIPRSSGGMTVSVSEAMKQAEQRRIAIIAVSHCWLSVDSSPPHPDNKEDMKAKSLTNFAEWYMQHWGQDIEVFFWIDYSCIDQDNRDVSVALLPAFIACCTAMVLWRTQDYETRSWTAMERVLAYSYSEGGLTPYVIDANFTNEGQESRWEPRKLPNPLSEDDSSAMAINASDRHFIQQLLQCVFAVPAFEVFPDRQSIAFGETEVVHLDLTTREPLRFADTAADGFMDGVDKRVWLAAADRPPVLNTGLKVRTKDQVALLMPADVADTFVPIFPVGGDAAADKPVAEEDFSTVVARFETLLASNGRPSEIEVGLLLEVLQTALEEALAMKDEQRLVEVTELCQKFKAYPPAALEGRRQLCRPRLVAALKGNDRILSHALQLAQQYSVDADDFPEFRAAVEEQDRRRANSLKADLEIQLSEAQRSKDDVLLFAVFQCAQRASEVPGASDDLRTLANEASEGLASIIAEKLKVPGIEDDADELQKILELAASYCVEKSDLVEEYREKLSVMRLDVSRITDSISLAADAESIDTIIEEIMKTGVPTWVIYPLLLKILDWGLEQSSANDLQESLRVVTVLGLSQDEEKFQAGVKKLKEIMEGELPEDWDILKQEWSQAHFSVQQIRIAENDQLAESVQALFDITMVGHKISTADRHGSISSRLKVKRVMKVRHPGNYLRYKTCKAKMNETLGDKENVQELGSVKTDVAAELPGLIDKRELDSTINEVILFHGTSYEAADKIAAEGFNMKLAGSHTGSMYGRGSYFAERALKSDEYAGCGHGNRTSDCCNTDRPILICRVLLGKFKYDDEPNPDTYALENACLTGDFDSILADREAANIKRGRNPTYREFVVFDKAQVYPEYVVWYTRCRFEKIPKIIHPSLVRSRPPSNPSVGAPASEASAASGSTDLPTDASSSTAADGSRAGPTQASDLVVDDVEQDITQI